MDGKSDGADKRCLRGNKVRVDVVETIGESCSCGKPDVIMLRGILGHVGVCGTECVTILREVASLYLLTASAYDTLFIVLISVIVLAFKYASQPLNPLACCSFQFLHLYRLIFV